MISITFPTIKEACKIASFIGTLNKQNEHHIGYIGTKVEEIENALLNDFSDIPFHKSFVMAYEDNQLVGVLGFDVDLENEQAEAWGPFVVHSKSGKISDLMWDSILKIVPREVKTLSFFVNESNRNCIGFAVKQSAEEKGLHSILTITKEQLAEQYIGGMKEMADQERMAVVDLHNEIFPNSYLSGKRMIDNVNELNKLFVCKKEGEFAGYIYVEANPEFGDASIEFFAVSPAYRGKGIGKALLLHGVSWLLSFDSINKIQLCVNAKSEQAIRLYKKIGFEEIYTLIYLEKDIS
ncbi:GNAT family N-acetyltransferase [Bacillus sp. FJAT-45066]|uniref:GNAT family N-acetyltransferase n=1 Tax=Bacillus sp. FJAT-45066 TaxID=2011010 RepID=UPI000BB89A8E|nr:GNAT family N-acetyltransferase [Bacillus sp. FJAT-45066]